MEIQRTQTATREPDSNSFEGIYSDNFEERLSTLLAANAEIELEKKLYPTRHEQIEAALIKNPISVKKAFSYFGLMLGTFPPAAIFLQVLPPGRQETGLLLLLLFVNFICALTGFFSGKLIG